MRTNEIKNELDEIRGWKEEIKRNNLKYETNKHIYDFQQLKTIRSFGESIVSGKITVGEADEDQSNLLESRMEFNNKYRARTKERNV